MLKIAVESQIYNTFDALMDSTNAHVTHAMTSSRWWDVVKDGQGSISHGSVNY